MEDETKYTIDVFTKKSVGTKLPENSYFVDKLASVTHIIKHCTRKEAGIRQVQVWINKPVDEDIDSLEVEGEFDFYRKMAAKLLDKSEEEITLKERQETKMNFHVIMYNKGDDYGKNETCYKGT